VARKITSPKKPIRPFLSSLTLQERKEILQPGEEAAPNLSEIFARLGKKRSTGKSRLGKRRKGAGAEAVATEWRREEGEAQGQVYARPLDPSVLQQMPVSSKTFYERGFLERLVEKVKRG
jgi:hypothetical protein